MLMGIRGALAAWPVGAALLGGQTMLASTDGVDQSFDDEHRKRAIAHLIAALEILDAHGEAPELGARLQGIIDSLDYVVSPSRPA